MGVFEGKPPRQVGRLSVVFGLPGAQDCSPVPLSQRVTGGQQAVAP